MAKYHIRYEKCGGTWYFDIYTKLLFFGWVFFERCNTHDYVVERLKELNNEIS